MHWLVLFVATACAAQVQQGPQYIQFNFSGGLNYRDRPTQMEAKFSTDDSYNFDFLPTGVGIKRKGTNLDATTSIPNGLGSFDRGRVFVDEAGVYLDNQYISALLGSVIKDSASVGRLHPDSVAVTVFDERVFVAVVENTTSLLCDLWVYNRRYTNWARYTGWKPVAWGEWRPSTFSSMQLFWQERSGTTRIYQYDESRTTDDSTNGNAGPIAAQLITPAFNFGDDDAIWHELYLTIDANDSVKVTFQIGAFDSTFTVGPSRNDSSGLYPIRQVDSTMTSGVPKTFIIPIRATGRSCQITIYTSGTGRCTIYPSAILAERKRI